MSSCNNNTMLILLVLLFFLLNSNFVKEKFGAFPTDPSDYYFNLARKIQYLEYQNDWILRTLGLLSPEYDLKNFHEWNCFVNKECLE